MIRKPFPTEWDTSQIPTGSRAYLEYNHSFEETVARIIAKAEIVSASLKPYEAPAQGEARDARQVIFLILVGREICDFLFNDRDGLRARYWQSPDHGLLATRHLIDALSDLLLESALSHPPKRLGNAKDMACDEMIASLRSPSAKVWPREYDDDRNWLFAEDKLLVPRWRDNERYATVNTGLWRRTPASGDLEIKGALLSDGLEYIPDGKRDRSCQLHRFGFT